MAFAQGLRHGEAVHQSGHTAAGLIHQAVQQLDPGYRRAIGIVGVRIKCQRRVSEVVGIGCGAHVEQRTEIRLAREPEHRTQLEHHARLGGHALENQESESQECFQPRAQLGRARVGAPARPRQLGERAVPQPRRGAIVAGGRERRFREDLLGVETRFMSVAEFDPVSTRQRLRHRHQRELNIEVRRILQPRMRVAVLTPAVYFLLPDKGSTAMSLSRRELLTASALLLAGPGAALRAAGKEAAAGETPMVLCWNENPYGPSPAARLAVSRSIAQGCRYPADAEIQALVEALARHEGVGADCIVTGTGSGELLCALGLLCGRDGGEIIAAAPTYAELPDYARLRGATLKFVPVDAALRHDLPAMH